MASGAPRRPPPGDHRREIESTVAYDHQPDEASREQHDSAYHDPPVR